MPITYADLLGPTGDNNIGGTKQFFLWAPKDDFTTIAKVPNPPVNMNDLVEIADDHTFPIDKGFVKIYCTMDRGELNENIQGERDGYSYKAEAKAFYPGDDATALGTFAQMKNQQGIVLIPLIQSDGSEKYMQIGIEDLWAEVKGNFGAAKNAEGVKGTELMIESNQPVPYIYSGNVTLLP